MADERGKAKQQFYFNATPSTDDVEDEFLLNNAVPISLIPTFL